LEFLKKVLKNHKPDLSMLSDSKKLKTLQSKRLVADSGHLVVI
jgi:hypothetical protein